MKRKLFLVAIMVIALISANKAQQWGGSTSQTGGIYRNGNVGFGSFSEESVGPSALIHIMSTSSEMKVERTALVGGHAGICYFTSGYNSTNPLWETGLYNSSPNFNIWTWDGSAASIKFSIKPSGYVGVGTNDPTQKIEVKDGNILINAGISNYGVKFMREGVDAGFIFAPAPSRLYIRDGADGGADLIIDNGNVGIGVQSTYPEKLNVNGGIKIANTTTNSAGTIRFTGSDFQGYVNGTWKSFTSTGNWQINGANTIITTGNVGIGTSNPTALLTVNGKIEAEEVEVKDIAADYVFDNNYSLMPLSELENYIKINKHLPNIAPAIETEKGVNLGEFNEKLLEKIEELTLYVIQLENKLNEIEKNSK
jgi:hypothetical protein